MPRDVKHGEEDRREDGTHQSVSKRDRVADDAGEECDRRENPDRLPVDGSRIKRKLRHTYDPPLKPFGGLFLFPSGGSFRQPDRICKPRGEAFDYPVILARRDDSVLAEDVAPAVS